MVSAIARRASPDAISNRREDIPKILQIALRAPGSRSNEPGWRYLKKDGTVFPAKVVSWEITFDGHKAALVLAEAVRSASIQN